MMNTALTMISGNAKVGKMPVSVTSKDSCPLSCPFHPTKKGGCYASAGPAHIHWKNVSEGKRGGSMEEFASKVSVLPNGQIWRHNVSGDLYGEGEEIDEQSLNKLVAANMGKKGFTYTHKYNSKKNLDMIAKANRFGFTINLSANNMSHAVELMEKGGGSPVVCVLPTAYQRKFERVGGAWLETDVAYRERLKGLNTNLSNGTKIVVCPATYRDNVTCQSCQLCQKANRSVVVGFPAHGNSKNTVDKIVKND